MQQKDISVLYAQTQHTRRHPEQATQRVVLSQRFYMDLYGEISRCTDPSTAAANEFASFAQDDGVLI